MNDKSQMAIERNLSYVLHEPSTSVVVRNFAADLRREGTRVRRAVARFADLTDVDLRQRIVVEPVDGQNSLGEISTLGVLSVKVGAWKLLSRTLRLSGLVPAQARLVVRFLDDDWCEVTDTMPFFRAPARLCLPRAVAVETSSWCFASALLRPGGTSILLRFDAINLDPDPGGLVGNAWERTRPLAEKSIREFVLQWGCDRALWERPAEEILPEFRLKTNGTTECGR